MLIYTFEQILLHDSVRFAERLMTSWLKLFKFKKGIRFPDSETTYSIYNITQRNISPNQNETRS